MTAGPDGRLLAKLRALFDAIVEEAGANPSFAAKVEAALADRKEPQPNHAPKGPNETHKMLHNVFDPLECHIEAALLNGREQEARAFLGKLNSAQLEAVVKAQRLPGAKGLQKTIQEADAESVVDAILGSAAERVRNRLSAAG